MKLPSKVIESIGNWHPDFTPLWVRLRNIGRISSTFAETRTIPPTLGTHQMARKEVKHRGPADL